MKSSPSLLNLISIFVFDFSTACSLSGVLGVTGSDGTFEIDVAAAALPLKCGVLFRSIYDEKKIEFKCADVPSYITVQVSHLFDETCSSYAR